MAAISTKDDGKLYERWPKNKWLYWYWWYDWYHGTRYVSSWKILSVICFMHPWMLWHKFCHSDIG
jgi:hypothetical protein